METRLTVAHGGSICEREDAKSKPIWRDCWQDLNLRASAVAVDEVILLLAEIGDKMPTVTGTTVIDVTGVANGPSCERCARSRTTTMLRRARHLHWHLLIREREQRCLQ